MSDPTCPRARPRAAAAVATALLACSATQAATPLLTETFDGATPSNGIYGTGQIAGTGIEVVNGFVWIVNAGGAQGHAIDLGSGWYTNVVDPSTQVGSSTARSVASFDLLAGTTYTVNFDYSRQGFSAGNGPFDTALTVSLGSHSVRYSEVAGFYYGMDWHAGVLQFTALADEPGARVVLTASGPPGYSGMVVDNISMVGVAAPVPEPQAAWLLLAGLLATGAAVRRRRAG